MTVAGGSNEAMAIVEQWATGSPLPPPIVDYRRRAIEVATHIAPDLQETLMNTVQGSLNQLQVQLSVHSSRLDELEQRVCHLEEEKAALVAEVKQNTCAELSFPNHSA